jgi:hypothetical protein
VTRRALVARWVVGLVGVGLLAYAFLRDRPPAVQPAAAAPYTTGFPGGPAAARVMRSETMRPHGLPDPAHVDILDAYAVAKAAALEIQPGVELFGVSGAGFVRGTVDLGRAVHDGGSVGSADSAPKPPGTAAANAGPDMSLLFQFEWAGEGDAKRHIDVRVGPGGLRITNVEGAVFAHPKSSGGRTLGPLAEPRCSSRKAWATAVLSGVPEDAETTMLLRSGEAGPVWSLWVPGRPEHHREVDARTCALVAGAPGR